jgi:hypothetical protein
VLEGRQACARATVVALHLAVLFAFVGGFAEAAAAASLTPVGNPDITLDAQPMLGGVVTPGAWLAVRVDVENRGPAMSGEIRLAPSSGQGSTYSVAIELASGARQQHFLYTQVGPFGTRFDITLRTGDSVQASAHVAVEAAENSRRIYVVAEHPERVTPPLAASLQTKGTSNPKMVAISPEDLPPRVEPWSSMDLLVWHDVDSARLDAPRQAALQTWLATGGSLLVIGGSLGSTMFTGFPADLLPFQPSTAVEVSTVDLTALFGRLPTGAAPLPALTGSPVNGTPLWRVGADVIGARAPYGQGTVTLVGLDPTTDGFAASEAADALWKDAVPASSAWDAARLPTDDGFLVSSLGQLPAVRLPGGDVLLLLILAYVVVIGPVNYLILKRRDRREWAWLTMPLTIGVFGVAAYGLGVALKGSNVIVSELAIVEGAAGTDRGQAEVHVGVFSPGRTTFDLKVGPQTLISSTTNADNAARQRPLDVVIGDPATVRGFGVGFGAMRAFRAQTAVDVPLVQADLKVTNGNLDGTIVNASGETLDDVTVIYAGNGRILGSMSAGESRPVSIAPGAGNQLGPPLSWRLYTEGGGAEPVDARTAAARRAVIQHLEGGWEFDVPRAGTGIFSRGPMILVWLTGGLLQVDAASAAEHIGQTVFVLPARVAVAGHVVFQGGLLAPTVEAVDSTDGGKAADVLYLSRGTLTVNYRPIGFDGAFSVTRLGLRLGLDSAPVPSVDGVDLAPLAADEQPDPNAPLASNPRPNDGEADTPRLQLFDRQVGTWVEFEPVQLSASYDVLDPARYVDASGSFRARFVVRGGDSLQFTLSARLEGDVE